LSPEGTSNLSPQFICGWGRNAAGKVTTTGLSCGFEFGIAVPDRRCLLAPKGGDRFIGSFDFVRLDADIGLARSEFAAPFVDPDR
jgi:hypothetical protein